MEDPVTVPLKAGPHLILLKGLVPPGRLTGLRRCRRQPRQLLLLQPFTNRHALTPVNYIIRPETVRFLPKPADEIVPVPFQLRKTARNPFVSGFRAARIR